MKKRFVTALCATVLTLLASAAHATTLTYDVVINTTSLVGSSLAPFALDFQLTGGTPSPSSASIYNVTFGVPQAAPSDPPATAVGLASGTLASGVTLDVNSANFFSEFFEGFVPGGLLGFTLDVTLNGNAPSPDALAVKLLYDDGTGAFPEITTNGFANTLLLFNLDSANPTFQVFSGVDDFAGVSASAAPVPEPATLVLFGTGLLGMSARRWRTRRAS
ncbi:MAG: NF038129 family PEP-CTERM protein [Vicinamibacterales bacterium]